MTIRAKLQFYSILISAFLWGGMTVVFVKVPVNVPGKDPDYREIRIQLSAVSETEIDADSETESGVVQEMFEEIAEIPEPVVDQFPEQIPEQPPVVEEIVAEISVEVPEPAQAVPVQTPAPEPVQNAPAPAVTEKAEPVPAAKASAPVAEPKAAEPAPVAKAPVPAPEPAKQKIVKSVEQHMAEQNASRGTKKSADEVDWDALFGEDSNAKSSLSTEEKNFASVQGPVLSGSAASASASDSGFTTEASSGKGKSDSVSENTTSAINEIFNAAGSAPEGNATGSKNVSSGTGGESLFGVPDGKGYASSGNDGLSWEDGVLVRPLKKPAKSEISFTDEQKGLITASIRDIHISFTVAADGTVQRDSIEIDKNAGIPAAITQEIKRQISNWQFEIGTKDGQAVFVYSIIKE